MLMMGCLGASYVNIESTLVLTMSGGNVLNLPEMLDSILPGLLPFLFMIGGYVYLEKGKKATSIKLMLIYLAVVIIGVLLNIW